MAIFGPSSSNDMMRSRSGFNGLQTMKRDRWLILLLSLIPVVYSIAVMIAVARSGDIGLRCVFLTLVKQEVPSEYEWSPVRPEVGDQIIKIGDLPVRHYNDFVLAIREMSDRVGDKVEVVWLRPGDAAELKATATVSYRPTSTYVWSLVWFLQEMVIYLLGARVFWKRPRDDSARLFFVLCMFTVASYMGGYHWTEIVVAPILIYLFVFFAVFVPVVSLHFALVFPRPNPLYLLRRRLVLGSIYGLASLNVVLLWGCMRWSSWAGRHLSAEQGEAALYLLKILAYVSIGIAVVLFSLFFVCLLHNFFRRTRTNSERNQVRWVLLATLMAFPLIFYLLWRAWAEPARLGLSSAAWPMYAVSLLYTVAYALSITRYKLMQVEEMFNRGVVYVLVSVSAGLLYSGFLVLGTLLIGETLLDLRSTTGGLVAGITAIAILILSGAVRDRFQKAIDRRFYREKYKFDQAMRKMNLAVGSLVDRETLGRRLLEAASEVLRLEWGAIYLSGPNGSGYELVACAGAPPDERRLSDDNPLVLRLQHATSIRVPHAMSLAATSDPATDAMIALGGEAANALESDGKLAGLLVLGPKCSGLPYEDEEIAFLGALSSVATLALHSAGIQQTLEALNQDLRSKVNKIAEQQRRILILQDQLNGRAEAAQRSEHVEIHENADGSVSDAIHPAFGLMKGSSPVMRRMIEMARKVAESPSAVLIRGESGTGKELLAEAIHGSSPRAGRPFVKVNCAALSQSLLESELFGHVKSAFTGADRDRVGRFEQANGGTLFLDEIGDINLEVQTKLLRVLQEMSFERVGSSQSISVDVRILAATHQDLEELIRQGRFREDLFYRLNVISLRTPSLRERKDDILELAMHFLSKQAARVGRPITHLDPEAVEALVAHDWPGNIRELGNVIERAVVLSDGPALTMSDLPIEVRQPSTIRRRMRTRLNVSNVSNLTTGGPSARQRYPSGNPSTLTTAASASAASQGTTDVDGEPDAFERMQLVDALDEARGNKSEAARLLGMPRSTFCSKLKKHGMI
jgi:transcriptional regulator with GAF, ATPase, and Fis domain